MAAAYIGYSTDYAIQVVANSSHHCYFPKSQLKINTIVHKISYSDACSHFCVYMMSDINYALPFKVLDIKADMHHHVDFELVDRGTQRSQILKHRQINSELFDPVQLVENTIKKNYHVLYTTKLDKE